ncbi:MAG: toxic anion resistance protein [Clostridiales bacterium]|nr:toxic anion resistance protein [Clostridiales bacterium]MDD7367253.1 toxic anion resistance protein [Clostridiales bacterium]
MADIKLTLGNEPAPAAPNPTAAATAEAPIEEIKEEVQEEVKKQTFSPEEQAQIDEFAKKIDITNSSLVFQYGAGTQQNIASFSDTALNNVRSKDLGEVGDMIAGLVTELRSFNVDSDEKKGLFSFLRQKVDKVQLLKNRYDDVEVNVNKLVNELENHQVQLLKDIATMDQLYDMNLTYFKELSMYIAAGNEALEAFRSGPLAEARAKAQQSGLPEDAQYASDLAAKAERFEKKLYDLELTRNVAIQMAPQIRLLQNNNQVLAEKIQSTIVNTIPLWKSQMVLALGLQHSQSAMEAQRSVTDLTNDLLRANAEKLRMGSVEIAKESERGIIDIETLTETNQKLIQTMDEVLEIQKTGRQKRKDAEKELVNIENQLRKKMLEMNIE